MSQTTENFLPAVTGQDLGSPTQQWDVFGNDVAIGGAFTVPMIAGMPIADQYAGVNAAAKITTAIGSLAAARGTVIIPSDLGSGSASSVPNNTELIDLRGTEQLIGTPSSGYVSNVLFNAYNGAGTTNRVFGLSSQATATAGGTGVASEGETVALFAAAKRSGGTRPIWGLNTQAQIDSTATGNSCISIEADINNNSGTDATISSNTTDLQFGVSIVSGGTNKPQAGIRIDKTSGAGHFREGIQVLSYDTNGIRIAGPSNAIVMVPTVEDGAAQISGTHTNGSAGPWNINHNGSASFANGTLTISSAGDLVAVGAAVSGALTALSANIGSGTAITQVKVYSQTITPAAVNAATAAEQTFTVTGLTTADKVIVNPAATGNATAVCAARVSAGDTIAIQFVNPTAGALTPASGSYKIVAIRS